MVGTWGNEHASLVVVKRYLKPLSPVCYWHPADFLADSCCRYISPSHAAFTSLGSHLRMHFGGHWPCCNDTSCKPLKEVSYHFHEYDQNWWVSIFRIAESFVFLITNSTKFQFILIYTPKQLGLHFLHSLKSSPPRSKITWYVFLCAFTRYKAMTKVGFRLKCGFSSSSSS